jgi:hypothetical protein
MKYPGEKARGGHARAESLTATECSKIASEVARSPWNNRETIPEIPHVLSGFKSELILGGTKLPCAVIQGANGVQRVLTENGITQAILGTRSGASKRLKKAASQDGALLPLFIAPGQLKAFIDKEFSMGP